MMAKGSDVQTENGPTRECAAHARDRLLTVTPADTGVTSVKSMSDADETPHYQYMSQKRQETGP